jgi:hypothetical protein
LGSYCRLGPREGSEDPTAQYERDRRRALVLVADLRRREPVELPQSLARADEEARDEDQPSRLHLHRDGTKDATRES